MMVSSPSLIHDMFYRDLLFFFNRKMKIKGLEVQKILSEPKATLQTITLEKEALTSCLGARFIICASTSISRLRGSSGTSSGVFQLHAATVDSAVAGC